MRRIALTLLAVAALAAAGCVSPTPAADDAAGTNTTAGDTLYEDDRIKIQSLNETPDEGSVPTLAAPPEWGLGEWWRVELTDDFTGGTHTTYRVVAGAENDNFLVGMPTHDFSNDIMVFHIPGFGQVSRADLSFEIHDCPFKPLQFPLEQDATWNTQFECRDVTATVIETTDTTATVELIGNNDHVTLTYDAEMRTITEFSKPGYGHFKVLEHGRAFHEDVDGMMGQVTVPHMHDLIFQHGRIGGAIDMTISPNGPVDNVEVDSTYDRVSFVIILGNLWGLSPAGALPAGGYYKETATAPDGTVYELEMTPDDASEFKIVGYKHDAPGGTWQFQHVAAGPGIAMAEGIAYHVYDVELPSGRILPSVGEHKHGSGEGHGGH